MKHGDHWDILARVFKLKGPSFEGMVSKFVSLISGHLYKSLVLDSAIEFPMKIIDQSETKFSNFFEALYAVDVNFQQSFRPSGSIQEGKLHFSGKDKLYGLKTEVSVTPIGLAINCSKHFPGSVSYFEIIQWGIDRHKLLLTKKDDELGILDVGIFQERYPGHWAVLADKGYQGIQEILSSIIPIKRPLRGVLSISDEAFNRRVAIVRIIVENWFSRLCTLWSLLSTKCRWNESIYDHLFQTAAALTNLHIKFHPLQSQDGDKYVQLQNRLSHIASETI